MYIDKFLQVSTNQAVTATASSTDVIDFGQANPNPGLSDHANLVVTVGTAVAAAGAATVTFVLQDSADNSSWADVMASGPIPKATLTAGFQLALAMPPKLRRYVRVNYVVGTGPLTAGSFSAQVVAGFQQNTAYPDSPRIQ